MMIRSLEIGSHHKDFRKLLKFIETRLSLCPWDLIRNFFQIQAVWSIVGFYAFLRRMTEYLGPCVPNYIVERMSNLCAYSFPQSNIDINYVMSIKYLEILNDK